MQHSTQRTMDLGEVLSWANWIEGSSRILSFPRIREELLVLFAVQSVTVAHSLNSSFDDCLPKEVVDAHIRGYLLDRVWSYHLVTELVRKDVWACCSRVLQIDSRQLLRASGTMVARVMLQQRISSKDIDVRKVAGRAVLRRLELSARKRGAAPILA